MSDAEPQAELEANTTGRVVVGVDGSENSLVALRWAKREAHLRGTPLTVLHAWGLPVLAGLSVSAVNWEEIEMSWRRTRPCSTTRSSTSAMTERSMRCWFGARSWRHC